MFFFILCNEIKYLPVVPPPPGRGSRSRKHLIKHLLFLLLLITLSLLLKFASNWQLPQLILELRQSIIFCKTLLQIYNGPALVLTERPTQMLYSANNTSESVTGWRLRVSWNTCWYECEWFVSFSCYLFHASVHLAQSQ